MRSISSEEGNGTRVIGVDNERKEEREVEKGEASARVRNDRREDENEMRKGGKEQEMTEIDGSLLCGARYCMCCSLATMKVNRGCHDIEAVGIKWMKGGTKLARRWMETLVEK